MRRGVKISYGLLAISYLQVLLWVFCLLSCASAASAATVNAQTQFESQTIGIFKSTVGTTPFVLDFKLDHAALELARKLEQPPVSQSAQPEEVLAAVSPQLASLSFRGGGFACLRETAAAESGSSVKPNGALFASLSL
eukprot:PRCOL_00001760-RA